jgi:hypothetical protein
MHVASSAHLPARLVYRLAIATLAIGVLGIAISFAFLASSDPRDVVAGAAGFVGGSLLASAALCSIAVLTPTVERLAPRCPATGDVSLQRWVAHFTRNRENRLEPAWAAPMTLTVAVVAPLVRSLEQFQLGDGGGPAYLIARNREVFLTSSAGMRRLVDLWFAEEREHSRLLGAAVARFGGRCIQGHWSFTAFCLSRRWFGVRFELTVLLLTEIASTVYYRLLRRHGDDVALQEMCGLILRDESGHIAFHRDRLAHAGRFGRLAFGRAWEWRFRLLGLGAATMLWVNHAPGLCAVGATRAEFYREVWRELSRFIGRLRREARA